jgi:chromosome segregation ATPase
MAREAMEDQVTMFEHFTNIKEEAAGQDEVVACVDACMDYWFGMRKSANDREALVEANVRQMQDKSVHDAERLTEALMRMREFSSDRQELEEVYNHTEKGLEARKDELVSLNKEFAKTRQQILEKAKLYVQQERTAARRAMQEAETAARKEVQETKKSAQKKEEELRAELKKAESEAQLTLKQAISDSQKQCTALTEEKADLDRQLRRCQAELQQEAKKAQELGSDLKLKSVQISSLQEQLDELKTRMKDETASKQAELDDKKRDLAGLLQSLTEKQAFEKSILADLKESSNALGKTQQELRKAQEDCADLSSQLKEALERLESLQKSSEATIQNLQRSAQEDSARLKSSVQRLTNELSLSDTQRRAYEEAQLKVKTRAIMQRLRNRMVVRLFGRWHENAAESRQMKVIFRKVVMRMKSRLLVECFVRWYDNTQEELRLKKGARQVLLRLMNIGLAKSFDRWSTRVAEEKHLRATVRNVVLRMMNLCLVGAFEGWREHAEEQKRMRDVARKVVQRWVKSSLVICFEGWQRIVEEEMFKQEEERVRQNEERLQEETENQKTTATQLKSQLEHERTEWEAAKKELESQVAALTTDLNDKVGEVQIVKVQTQRAQRAVIDTQKKLDDTTTKQVQVQAFLCFRFFFFARTNICQFAMRVCLLFVPPNINIS